MSDKNPCPLCGDYSEYLRFLDLCAEHANEIQRENDLKVFTNMCKSLDLVQVVRCHDCKHRAGANVQAVISDLCMWLNIIVKPDGFCAWGERSEP